MAAGWTARRFLWDRGWVITAGVGFGDLSRGKTTVTGGRTLDRRVVIGEFFVGCGASLPWPGRHPPL